MAYASESDLVAAAGGLKRLNQLLDKEPPADWTGAARDYWIAEAQKRGDAFVESLLAVRFKTPVDPSHQSEWLKQRAADEGVYFLATSTDMATKDEHDKAELRLRMLEDARDGKRWPANTLPPKSTGMRSAFVENTQPFSRKRMKGFV